MISKSKQYKNIELGKVLRIVIGIIMLASIAEPVSASIYDIDGEVGGGGNNEVGDTIYGQVCLYNEGTSVETNLRAWVQSEGLEISPPEFDLNIGDLNPGTWKCVEFSFEATGASEGELWLTAYGDGGWGGQIGDWQLEIYEPEPESVPEFPTVALPVIAMIGLVFLLQRRKGK